MFRFIIDNLVWIHGWQILVVLATLAIFGFLFSRILLFATIAFFIFTIYFFRNPQRSCPEQVRDNSVLICPADGKVVDIAFDKNNAYEGYAQKVSIFLSAFDVHVNWIPISGTVSQIEYKPGKFMFAFLPKSSELNERNDIEISTPKGKKIKVRQIAGTIARRICCWVDEEQKVDAGDKFGMIRFGSRVDVFLPEDVQLLVKKEQRVVGGQTILGRWQ